MSNDQVGCEWVSVSSGTGLPGLTRTEAVKRLCVCVYITVNACNRITPENNYCPRPKFEKLVNRFVIF